MNINAFTITAWQHPGGFGYQAFPKGIWYGRVDGLDCTAPCHTAERAKQEAQVMLSSGSIRAQILTGIDCYEGWLRQDLGEKGHAEALEKLARYRAFLAKLDEHDIPQR